VAFSFGKDWEVVGMVKNARDIATQTKKRAFLAAYAEVGTITRAAEIAGVERKSHYLWMAKDPAYVEAFAAAGEQAGDRLEQECLFCIGAFFILFGG
jgi:hypothetical protein